MHTNYWLFVLTESDPLILILSAGQQPISRNQLLAIEPKPARTVIPAAA